ncbi:MAG: hypothetical protein ACE5JL_15895, partial [Dehalococcoidia bacterium]
LQLGSREALPQIVLARYYSPVGTFRFASVDPGDDTDSRRPQSWNKYAYVRNSPLVFSDPSGRNITNLATDPATKVAANLLVKSLTIQARFGGPGRDLVIRNIQAPLAHPRGGNTTAKTTPTYDRNGNLIKAEVVIYPHGADNPSESDTGKMYSDVKHELGHASLDADSTMPHLEGMADDRGAVIEYEALAAQDAEQGTKSYIPESPGPKGRRQGGTEIPGESVANLEAQGFTVSIDGGSSNSGLKFGFRSSSHQTSHCQTKCN